MHFFITCGLFLCVTMLLVLPVQGKHVLKVGPHPPCCTKVSGAPIRQRVKRCYEQLPNILLHCEVHAYIFITDDQQYCVDPHASWVKNRLNKLKDKNIYCKKLVHRQCRS